MFMEVCLLPIAEVRDKDSEGGARGFGIPGLKVYD